MIVAIISGFLYAATYFSLAITYFLVLCINVPSFLVNERLRKKYQDDGTMLFKRKHIIPLFASGILIFEFTAVIAINFQIPTVELQPQPLLLMYIVFVPCAVIRVVLETLKVIKYRKTGDPYIRTSLLMSIYCVIFTVAKLFGGLYLIHKDVPALMYVAGIFALLFMIYSFSILIYLLIVGIRGLMGKRKKAFQCFLKGNK